MILVAAGALLTLAAFAAWTATDIYVVQRWLGK
jgi:hypothetical protein